MQKNIILLIVAFSMFMESVDTTILNTAIPVIANNLQANPINLKLALISYLLSLAIFIPISGWIADKFGVKKVFIAAVTLFTLSSIWCGYTHNLLELVLARVVQGVGGSLTVPVGRLIILRTCERHELITKMSMVVMVSAVGMMLGPLLGGIITTHLSWRWIFWVNAPIGILTVLLAYYLLPEMPPKRVHKLDILGFLYFGFGLASLTLGLATTSETDIPFSVSWILIGIACILLMIYTKYSTKKKHPIVAINLFKIRTFRIAITGNLLARLGFGGIPFLLPLLLQVGLHFSPQRSGLLIAPMALGVFLVKPLSFYILRYLGYKNLLIINTLCVAFAICLLATIQSTTPLYCIALMTFLYGFLIALQYTGMNSLAYAEITVEDVSAANSMMSTIQQLAQSFGVAVAAILLRLFEGVFSKNIVLSTSIFHQTCYGLAILTVLSILIFFQLEKNDGNQLIYSE